MRDPETDREWQDAVDAAKGALALDSARTYGFVKGGPDVDVSRCFAILDGGASRRPPVLPSADAVERFLEGR